MDNEYLLVVDRVFDINKHLEVFSYNVEENQFLETVIIDVFIMIRILLQT